MRLVRISRMFIKRLQTACLWGVHYLGYSVCMHIINTCAAWQRCESESFSSKWSASRERNKEICSCQGSVRQRLLLEIFWKKSHVWRLSALLSSHFKLRSVESKKKRRSTWVGEFWCWDGHGTSAFWKAGDKPFTWSFRGRRRAQVFCSYIKTCITQLKLQCL